MPQTTDQLTETVRKALHRAYNLGQTYWQQADSESCAANKRSEETAAKFDQLSAETLAALSAVPLVAEAPREMGDAAIERLAGEYIAEDWEPDRYYRNMNVVAFARALLASVAPQPEQPNTEQPHLADNGEQAVQGLDADLAPRYYCNKCGSFPDAVQHKRPDGTDCPYIARTAHGVALPHSRPRCRKEGGMCAMTPDGAGNPATGICPECGVDCGNAGVQVPRTGATIDEANTALAVARTREEKLAACELLAAAAQAEVSRLRAAGMGGSAK